MRKWGRRQDLRAAALCMRDSFISAFLLLIPSGMLVVRYAGYAKAAGSSSAGLTCTVT